MVCVGAVNSGALSCRAGWAGVAGATAAAYERGCTQSTVACSPLQRLHGALHVAVGWPKMAHRAHRDDVQEAPK